MSHNNRVFNTEAYIMKMLLATAWAVILTFSSSSRADLYLELGFENGGDELIGTNTGEEISAGGGLKFAGGIQNPLNDEGTASLRLAVGYLFDNINADNGEADIDTLTFDVTYLMNSGPHSFGVGPTIHLAPEYTDNVAGFPPLRVEFDDAIGLVLQYGYHPVPGFEIGFRFSDIEYENNGDSLDASSFGVFISNGF